MFKVKPKFPQRNIESVKRFTDIHLNVNFYARTIDYSSQGKGLIT